MTTKGFCQFRFPQYREPKIWSPYHDNRNSHIASVFQSGNMICAKCFVVFNSFDDIYATLCGHCFHRNCIVNNCSRCPNCFQALSGSFNLIKLNALFENETHDKQKLKKAIEAREQTNFLKYQLQKEREDVQKLKSDLEQAQLLCAELKLDIQAERKMRRFHQLQLEGAAQTPSKTNDIEVIKISSDDEPAQKQGRKTSRTKSCHLCKAGCKTKKCPCFKSSLGCWGMCGCTQCDNKKGREKAPLIKTKKLVKKVRKVKASRPKK